MGRGCLRSTVPRSFRDGVVDGRALVLWLTGLKPLEFKLLLPNHIEEAVLLNVSYVLHAPNLVDIRHALPVPLPVPDGAHLGSGPGDDGDLPAKASRRVAAGWKPGLQNVRGPSRLGLARRDR